MITYIVIAIIGGILAGWLLAWLGPLARMRDKLVERDTAVDRQAGQLEALRDELALPTRVTIWWLPRSAKVRRRSYLPVHGRLSETSSALRQRQGNNQAFLGCAPLNTKSPPRRSGTRQQAVAQLVANAGYP